MTETTAPSDGQHAEAAASPAIEAARFRQVLGHFPTGVTVITADYEGIPVGMAVGSFASLSLDPPLVMFGAGHSSSTWPRVRAAAKFCVNVLGADQEDVSRVFASRSDDKFAEVGWRPAANGAPLLDGVLASIQCDLYAVHDGGDHDLAVGLVTALDLAEGEHGPLLFYRGGYGRFAI